MGSRVRIRLFHLHFAMDFLFPLLKNSKSGVDDRVTASDQGHRLRITHTRRRRNFCQWKSEKLIVPQIFSSYQSIISKQVWTDRFWGATNFVWTLFVDENFVSKEQNVWVETSLYIVFWTKQLLLSAQSSKPILFSNCIFKPFIQDTKWYVPCTMCTAIYTWTVCHTFTAFYPCTHLNGLFRT